MEDKIHVGDIGTVIRINLAESLAALSNQVINIQKPDGSEVIWAGTIDGQLITYTTVANDLDIPGRWIAQAYGQFNGGIDWRGLGDSVAFFVHPAYSLD